MADENQKWKREFSAGGVVYKKEDGKVYILLINPKSRNFGPPEDYWTFPKGKREKDEELAAAAVRETREEAGVEAEIEQELGYQKYFRNWKGDEAIKFVHYYLMKYIDGDLKDHDEEVANVDWFDIDEVESKLEFNTDKEIFGKAKELLKYFNSSP